jgi:peptidoglycan/LPS O-acetylase OafA/YrhL
MAEFQPSVQAARPRALPALTGLRFVAALSVVAVHGATSMQQAGTGYDLSAHLVGLTRFGMTLFFVLSGFVIHYNYCSTIINRKIAGTGRFILARIARLYPLFILVCLIDFLFGRQLAEYVQGQPGALDPIGYALPYFLTLTQSWIPRDPEGHPLMRDWGVNTQLTWSVSTEWFFYLVYPLVAVIVHRLRRARFAIALVLAWCVLSLIVVGLANGSHAAATNYEWFIYESPYLRISEFVLGVLVAQLYSILADRKPGLREAWAGSIAGWLTIIGAVVEIALLGRAAAAGHVPTSLTLTFGYAPLCALLIFCTTRYDNWLARFFSQPLIITLGDASYSQYLLHIYVMQLLVAMVVMFYPPLPPVATGALVVPICVIKVAAAVILVSMVSVGSYRLFENPARQWIRRLPQSLFRWQLRATEPTAITAPPDAVIEPQTVSD